MNDIKSINFKSTTDYNQALGALKVLGIQIESSTPLKQKKYKERTYEVVVGPTTRASGKTDVIVGTLKDKFSNLRANMTVTSNWFIEPDSIPTAENVRFNVLYKARGNCPADIRGSVKKMLKDVVTTATVTVKALN